MMTNPRYALRTARMTDGSQHFVIADTDDRLHLAGSSWLKFLADSGRSPNTLRTYGPKVAQYLSWVVTTEDWRGVKIGHLALWRNMLESSPAKARLGAPSKRSRGTVDLWITSLRSFYLWADAQGLLRSDIASRMTQTKYFPPGTSAGGEYGRSRQVVVEALRPAGPRSVSAPEWIDDAEARRKFEELELPARDRFLVNLMYETGIRAGEALSLFTKDMHFGGGFDAECRRVDPHFHVETDNPVENGARSKGCARVLWVGSALVEDYIDYVLERARLLGNDEESAHVFVNTYTHGEYRGRAMSYSGLKKLVGRCAARIGFDLTGPHMFRHTLATRLLRGIDCEKQDMDVVQAILGHASIESTRIYTHDAEPAMKKAMMSVAGRNLGWTLA